ncbi:MAG TPA: hypothetical protein VF622_12810 [Segetibacter sp.]|jgi:hypothetical protein
MDNKPNAPEEETKKITQAHFTEADWFFLDIYAKMIFGEDHDIRKNLEDEN